MCGRVILLPTMLHPHSSSACKFCGGKPYIRVGLAFLRPYHAPHMLHAPDNIPPNPISDYESSSSHIFILEYDIIVGAGSSNYQKFVRIARKRAGRANQGRKGHHEKPTRRNQRNEKGNRTTKAEAKENEEEKRLCENGKCNNQSEKSV